MTIATPTFPTFDTRLRDANFRPSGFDYMRIVLATLVVCVHSLDVTDPVLTHTVWFGPLRGLLALILPMFFCLSGFLVAGSFVRCQTIISFGGLRLIRLVPALVVDTVISALLLGPMFTTLALDDYFSNKQFFLYFQNLYGHVQFYLPGVFENNPFPSVVNGQLWTLPFELKCYVALILLSIVGIAQRPKLFLLVVVLLNVAYLVDTVLHGQPLKKPTNGEVMVLCFLYGIAAFHFKQYIAWNKYWFALSAVVSICLLGFHNYLDVLVAFPVAYMTVYLGLAQPKRSVLVTSGDFSYGIFLYGFPVQQAFVHLLPPGQMWYTNLALSLPVTIVIAMLSWKFVESPSLKLKGSLLKFEAFCLRMSNAVPGGGFILPSLATRGATVAMPPTSPLEAPMAKGEAQPN